MIFLFEATVLSRLDGFDSRASFSNREEDDEDDDNDDNDDDEEEEEEDDDDDDDESGGSLQNCGVRVAGEKETKEKSVPNEEGLKATQFSYKVWYWVKLSPKMRPSGIGYKERA